MGQYYKPVSIEKKEHVLSHSYNCGLKLMEHSWLNNSFVKAVCTLIAVGGAWYGDRIVWAGDYADHEPDDVRHPDYPNDTVNLYHLCDTEVKPKIPQKGFRYVINMDTKEYVNTTKIPISDLWTDDKGKEHPFIIHPLPILTCEGNGRGGGDLHKESYLIGKWARARVSVTDEIPKDYKELKFNLYEGMSPMELTPKPKKEKTIKNFKYVLNKEKTIKV
jgi:hypothetical protein